MTTIAGIEYYSYARNTGSYKPNMVPEGRLLVDYCLLSRAPFQVPCWFSDMGLGSKLVQRILCYHPSTHDTPPDPNKA